MVRLGFALNESTAAAKSLSQPNFALIDSMAEVVGLKLVRSQLM